MYFLSNINLLSSSPVTQFICLFMRHSIFVLFSCLSLAFIHAGCSSSADVQSGRLIQKRKYRHGFVVNWRQGHLERRDDLVVPGEFSEDQIAERVPTSDTFNLIPTAREESQRNIPALPTLADIRLVEFTPRFVLRRHAHSLAHHRVELAASESDTAKARSYHPATPGGIALGMLAANSVGIFIPFVGVFLSVAAIGLSVRSLRNKNDLARTLGVVGLILGALSLLASLFFTTIIMAAAISTAIWQW